MFNTFTVQQTAGCEEKDVLSYAYNTEIICKSRTVYSNQK